ncbi:(d)CMP kinase [Pradoshia sp. D12]|uniref:(d)CMP kinase n=1 Tax=Bacillaceae TaxID=186817 RepID=UPI00080AFAC3|nr:MULTISPECIES: (d)CMP kinase [Bacillaceae]OCA83582.1 cytidylate kinase [Bacillus sp. FJAT-27986]QFK71823.1 (d)CMP kinase [Pradoshia sp. D12]TPF73618.1 (d)CMP kinase [Bacillus sp. D12]
MKKKLSIAIDGPAAAGKSTVAKIIARRLTYIYIDTGAMYRALTYKALNNGIDPNNEAALYDLLMSTDIKLQNSEQGQDVLVDGVIVSEEIRTPNVTKNVSAVSQHKLVREEMVRRQQLLSEQGGVVMDGRDIGTQVMPNAEVKIFMLASVDERAKRRHEENILKGFDSDIEQLKQDIAARDKFDSEREVSPLKKAADAIELDTTSLSIDEVVDAIMKIANEKGVYG